jgi:hypothetical protein
VEPFSFWENLRKNNKIPHPTIFHILQLVKLSSGEKARIMEIKLMLNVKEEKYKNFS